MSRLPVANKQEQKDEDSLQLFLFYSPFTKYFYITLTKKRDGIDFDKYLTVQAWIYFNMTWVNWACFKSDEINITRTSLIRLNWWS